ncbi:hypothetical protein SAY87_013506 [Trapa incisa]|uniref:LOB domain-containing protein n=1 Tax=Trapa incisa TaxID=236973 RepID=A0AAN7K8T8_9MYRT|nr:hypothetical protein SAY87_013506 [Trapa incisa]
MGCQGRSLFQVETVATGLPPVHYPSSPVPAALMITSPCAACKILRRKCSDKCIMAPYFPPTEPAKFTVIHRIFGASNVTKYLKELPESHRADAVSAMAYEASARIRDPVYGSAGFICMLQKQVNELQAELARAQAEISSMRLQQAHLRDLIVYTDWRWSFPSSSADRSIGSYMSQATAYETLPSSSCTGFKYNEDSSSPWESLWA